MFVCKNIFLFIKNAYTLSGLCSPFVWMSRRSKIMWEFHWMKITLIIIPSNSENYSNNSGTYKSSKMGEKSEMKVNHIIYLKL